MCSEIQSRWLDLSGEYKDIAASPKMLLVDAYAPSNRC